MYRKIRKISIIIRTVLQKLADSLNDDAMRELNYQVDVLKRNPKDVAIEFLQSKDMIS